MERWVILAREGDVDPGAGRTVVAGDLRIALFNDGGVYLAIDDTCPHQGASLGEGLLHEGRVICPWHSWIFDLRTGQCPRGTHPGVRSYATRCREGRVELQLPGDVAGPE